MTSVAIIIPAWNEAGTLEATVKSLLRVEYELSKCEVIVVAGGGDGTHKKAGELASIMRFFSRYVVILQHPPGKNSAIQQGIKEARNNIIVLLDADTIVSAGWLRGMVKSIDENRVDLTIANPFPVRMNWVSNYYMVVKMYLLDHLLMFSGHSMAFRTDSVRNELDYFFDKNTKVGVDYLLAKRFWGMGRKSELVEEAVVETHFPSSLKYFVLGESRWLTALIEIDGVNLRRLLCNSGIVAALVLMLSPFRILATLSIGLHLLYIAKRLRMYLITSQHQRISVKRLFGFILLSYIHQVVGFICHAKYFLGLTKESELRQGQRY